MLAKERLVFKIAHYRSECPIYRFDRLFLAAAIGLYPIPCKLV